MFPLVKRIMKKKILQNFDRNDWKSAGNGGSLLNMKFQFILMESTKVLIVKILESNLLNEKLSCSNNDYKSVSSFVVRLENITAFHTDTNFLNFLWTTATANIYKSKSK